MTNIRTDRLRVAAPTLEPDPVFLGMLVELGASSRPAAPSTARSAGLRMIVATASVAVIAAATWAAGAPTGADIPLSPTDSPTQQEPSGPPSHGHVGTPQPDVSTSPGSPLSPGLPGKSTSRSSHASDAPRKGLQPERPGLRKGQHKVGHKAHRKAEDRRQDERRGEDTGRAPQIPLLPDASGSRVGDPGDVAGLDASSAKVGAGERSGADASLSPDVAAPSRGHRHAHRHTK